MTSSKQQCLVLLFGTLSLLSACSKRYEARPAESFAREPATSAAPATTLTPDPVDYTLRPAPLPSTEPRPQPAKIAPSLTVKRLVLATRIENREPADASKGFVASKTDKLFAFVEVENHSLTEGEIFVSFVPPDGGKALGNIKLDIGASKRFRTWAFTRGARKSGEWMAVVRNGAGDVLARAPFEII